MISLPGTPLICSDDSRKLAIAQDLHVIGIDYLEIEDPNVQTTLDVHFIHKTQAAAATEQSTDLQSVADNFNPVNPSIKISGGIRLKRIHVIGVTHPSPDVLHVTVDSYGDFSTYTLTIEYASIDPIYRQCEFSFKAGCHSRFDCQPPAVCPPMSDVEPLVDYQAKDFASFRQALVDLIPTLVPGWRERHDADLGMAMADLLAYSADQLSYYQDAVANEAFLATARHRISVRRHARLIDYPMHDGASARVFVQFQMANGVNRRLPSGTQVLTRIDTPLRNTYLPKTVVDTGYKDDALRAAAAVFETMEDISVSDARNCFATHSWQASPCRLSCGATSVDVEYSGDPSTLPTKDDFVLLEELGSSPHRQVVRLTDVLPLDPVHDFMDSSVHLATLRWDGNDALTVPFTVGNGASVVRGNLALCDHGMTVVEWFPGDPAAGSRGIVVNPTLAFRFPLQQGPLSQRIQDAPLTPVVQLEAAGPAAAVAQVHCDTDPPSGAPGWDWTHDLLDSNSFASKFVAETDNDGSTLIRFGSNDFGMSPPNGCHIKATYRVGVGAAANIGAGAIGHVIDDPGPSRPSNQDVDGVTNPLPAWGGADPEDMERVRLVAPAAFHATQQRAVTEADYAEIAERHPDVARAVARFTWTGSWRTVFITVQPKSSPDLTPDLKQRVKTFVEGFTIAGYDIEIRPPQYVALELDLFLCVKPDHFRADVEKAVITKLSSVITPTGDQGFFHHDRWPMGKPLFLSDLYAYVQSVEGVESVDITLLKRTVDPSTYDPTAIYKAQGFVKVSPLEAVRLDNDPSLPENGSLDLSSGGGK